MVPVAQRAAESTRRPGAMGDGTVLLPSGWRIAPAGRHLGVGDLPLAFAWSPDGASLVVSNNGYDTPTLTIVDARTFTVRATVPVEQAWLGLAWHPDGRRLYTTGGDQIQEFAYDGAHAEAAPRVPAAHVADRARRRTGRHAGRPAPVRHPRARAEGARGVRRFWGDRTDRRPARRGIRLPALAGRQAAVRVAVGRRQGHDLRRVVARSQGRGVRRRASERHGALAGRRPAVRRVRQHERGVGRRHRVDEGHRADRRLHVPEGAGRDHAERPRALSGRPHAARRQRRQQYGGGGGCGPGRPQHGRWVLPDRLVSDRGRLRPERPGRLRAEREGAVLAARIRAGRTR